MAQTLIRYEVQLLGLDHVLVHCLEYRAYGPAGALAPCRTILAWHFGVLNHDDEVVVLGLAFGRLV